MGICLLCSSSVWYVWLVARGGVGSGDVWGLADGVRRYLVALSSTKVPEPSVVLVVCPGCGAAIRWVYERTILARNEEFSFVLGIFILVVVTTASSPSLLP